MANRLTKPMKAWRHEMRLAHRFGTLPPPQKLLKNTRCVRCLRWHASEAEKRACLTPWKAKAEATA